MINFGKDKTLNVLAKSMDSAALRQRVISDNLANINTPNFKRQYVDFDSELKLAVDRQLGNKGRLLRTHERHLPLDLSINKIKPEVKTDFSRSMREDGNNVDLDLELADLAENTIRFNTLTETAIKKYSSIKSAVRGGR